MNKFRIPEGSRDLIPIDCKKKRKIEKQIEDTFISWGYEEVSTPSLEYYSCLLLNIDNKKSFKLIEEDSNVGSSSLMISAVGHYDKTANANLISFKLK